MLHRMVTGGCCIGWGREDAASDGDGRMLHRMPVQATAEAQARGTLGREGVPAGGGAHLMRGRVRGVLPAASGGVRQEGHHRRVRQLLLNAAPHAIRLRRLLPVKGLF